MKFTSIQRRTLYQCNVESLCCLPRTNVISFQFLGPIEFEEEKISVNSQTGPPSDISDRSGNISDKLSLSGNSLGGVSTPSASATTAGASGAAATAAPSAGAGGPMTPASSSTTPTAGVLRKESNSGTPGGDQPPPQARLRTWSALSSRGNSRDKGDEAAGASSSSSYALTETPPPASTSTKISSRATSLLNLFVPSNNSSSNSGNPATGGAQTASSSSASASQGSLGVAFGFPLGALTLSYIRTSYRIGGFPSLICFRRRSKCEETFQPVAVADPHSRGGRGSG